MTSPASRPDVTVIVIVYNDAERVPDAVASVLDQSLRSTELIIVDDASTDLTAQVCQRLAAEVPDRIRFISLPVNSGAGGRPRNVGMEHARGRYVMFLDSDDTLDKHACRNLMSTAESTGAEMVIGRCVRRYLESGKEQAWLAWLVNRQAVYDSLREEPELLYDVLSTNKLYRRDFLTRENLVFPEGRFYEDNLFSAHAYLTAKKIAVIPQRVYTWNVDRKASSMSVTNRPGELRNLIDRIAITQEIDNLLARYGTPELRLQKDVRFIENDLRTHMSGLRGLTESARRALVDVAAPYVATLSPAAFRAAKRLPAIAAYMVSRSDYDGVAALHRYMTRNPQRAQLTTDLVLRDGRVYWGDRYLDDPLGREVLDVTDLGLHERPLNGLGLGSQLLSVETAGNQVTLVGEITNPLGRITSRGKTRADLQFRDRRGERRTFSTGARIEIDETRVRWRATFDPTAVLRPIGLIDPIYSVTLRLTLGVEVVNLVIFADPGVCDQARLPVRPRTSRLIADELQAYTTDAGNIAFRLAASGRLARVGTNAISYLRSTKVGVWMWQQAVATQRATRAYWSQRATKAKYYHKVISKLPISKRTIVFESHMGKQYSDSPRAIYEELQRAKSAYRAVWVYASHPTAFPSGAKLVKRQSWAYFWALGRARFWVDNQGFPHDLAKRSGTTYIQTWHGSAFKRMGFDEATIKAKTASQQQRLQSAVDRFDAFVVRSEHDVRTLTKGLRVGGELLRVGYPRNDALMRGGDPAELTALRQQLRLGDDRTVVLYAPTFRPKADGGVETLEVPFDLAEFVERFGDKMVLLVRPHYLTNFVLPPALRSAVRNVTNVHDVTPLMQLADVLITDYSSVMFDYALLDRPMIFHVPDYDDYVGSSRGSYFDLAEKAPGPLTHDSAELFAALADVEGLSTRYAEQRRRFVVEFGEYDTGNAAKAIVEKYFVGARRG